MINVTKALDAFKKKIDGLSKEEFFEYLDEMGFEYERIDRNQAETNIKAAVQS